MTAGGTATGGAEPFGPGGRDALEAERDAGRWALRTTYGEPKQHSLERARYAPGTGSRAQDRGWGLPHQPRPAAGRHRQTVDPSTAPAPALTAKAGGSGVHTPQPRAQGRWTSQLAP